VIGNDETRTGLSAQKLSLGEEQTRNGQTASPGSCELKSGIYNAFVKVPLLERRLQRRDQTLLSTNDHPHPPSKSIRSRERRASALCN
jgi:hypothetical protein